MDDELRQFFRASVRVVSIPEKQLGRVAELGHGKVGDEGRLPALLPTMPTPAAVSASIAFGHGVSVKTGQRTNIGSLDHAHVVPAIPDTTNALFGEIPDKTRDVCLLRRRAPTSEDSGKLGRDVNKLVLKQGEAELRCGCVSEKSRSLVLESLPEARRR